MQGLRQDEMPFFRTLIRTAFAVVALGAAIATVFAALNGDDLLVTVMLAGMAIVAFVITLLMWRVR